MDHIEKQGLQKLISEYSKEKLIECLDAHYKEQPWTDVILGSQSIHDVANTIDKIYRQLSLLLESVDFPLYLNNFTPPVHGNSTLLQEVTNLTYAIEHKANLINNSVTIDWIFSYLLHYNLWNKAAINIKIENFESKVVDLELLVAKNRKESESLENFKTSYGQIVEDISLQKSALEQFTDIKRQELQTVADAVPLVTNQKLEVDAILKKVVQTEAQITVLQKNYSDLFEQLTLQKENQSKEYKTSVESIETDKKILETYLGVAEKQIDYFTSQKEFIEEKRKSIIALGALAADGALSGAYNLRQGDIKNDLHTWRIGVIISTIVAIAWTVAAFSKFQTRTGHEFLDIILNLLKTAPGFILMGFVYKHYSKERILQEEYAFKASIASTISAYSDLLKGDGSEETSNRHKMLIEVIKQVQTPPKFYTDEGKIFSFRNKTLTETIKTLNETITVLKSKA